MQQIHSTNSESKPIYDSFGSILLQVDGKSNQNNTIVMPNITIKGNAVAWLVQLVKDSRKEYIAREKQIEEFRAKVLAKYETMSYLMTAEWLRSNDYQKIYSS